MEIVRAFWIHAFADDKVFVFLFGNKGTAAVGGDSGALQRKNGCQSGRNGITDLAQELAFGTIVPV